MTTYRLESEVKIMEIKAELNNATEEQRTDFVVTYNHQQGYEIEEEIISEEKQTDENGDVTTVRTYNLKALGYTEEEKATEREQQFNQEFFNTSLGYVRRSVTMQDGSKKDFLSDLLPAIKAGLEMGQEVTVLTYDKPDFTKDVKDWVKYQNKKLASAQFVGECLQQVVKDFAG